MVWLVLWDIDHTLIDTRGVGRELSAIAFEETTGQPMQRQAKVDGITEPVIFRETARLHGLDTTRADFERFAAALAEQHILHTAVLRERGHALPGAAAAIDALAVAGIQQTVVTGNVRAVAETKLSVFGLDRNMAWETGAYGEDSDLRPGLVRCALERSCVSPADAVVIGDTPADVEGGMVTGVRVVAVATGQSGVDQLTAAGALDVLPDLRDTAAVMKAVLKQE